MLILNIEGTEFYDEEKEEFVVVGGTTISLEHSLLSVSKWESKFERPFLDKSEKSNDDMRAYVECMIFPPEENSGAINLLSPREIASVNDYINTPYSATTFGEMPERNTRRGEIITSELIYYWMVAYQIPFECETWHLNRLFSLIRICNIKAQEQSGKKTKVNRAEIAKRNAEINRQRLAEYGTRG